MVATAPRSGVFHPSPEDGIRAAKGHNAAEYAISPGLDRGLCL